MRGTGPSFSGPRYICPFWIVKEVEISGFKYRKPFAAIAGNHDAVAGPLQHDPHRRLHRGVVVHDQEVRQSRFLRVRKITVNGRLYRFRRICLFPQASSGAR